MEKIINTSSVQEFVEKWQEIVNFIFNGIFLITPVKALKDFRYSKNVIKPFLGKLNNPRLRERDIYFLADLINNAQRRIEEKKFDDAVARLLSSGRALLLRSISV